MLQIEYEYHYLFASLEMLLISISLVTLLLGYSAASHVVNVRHNGSNLSNCSSTGSCATVQLALAGLKADFQSANTTIYIHGPATYTLPANANGTTLSGAQNIVISGTDEGVVIECSRGAGLAFINSQNVTISQLTLNECGLVTAQLAAGYSSALLFHGCKDVTVDNVTISNSTGVGSIVQDTTGLVQIRNTVYTHNTCTASGNNGAGGLLLLQQLISSAVKYTITGCLFEQNTAAQPAVSSHAMFPSKGGGLMVNLQPSVPGTSLNIDSCSFIGNTAQYGGALYLELNGGSPVVNITDTSFQNSTAVSGSAIFITSQRTGSTVPTCVLLSAVDVYESSITVHENVATGIGAVYSEGVPVCLSQHVLFEQSSGTALAVSAAPIIVSSYSTVEFINNTGHDGGALALFNRAYLLVNSDSELKFIDNAAHLHGGAIFNSYYGLKQKANCFVQHVNKSLHPDHWNVSFIFDGNYANSQSNSIYSPSILSCEWHSSSTTNETALCWKDWHYPSDTCSSYVETAPAFYQLSAGTIRTFPGLTTQLPLTFFDDKSNEVTSKVVVSTFFDGNDTFANQYISDSTVTLYGEPATTAALTLETIGSRTLQVELTVDFMMCPPGLAVNDSSGKPTCSCVGHFVDKLIYDIESFHSYLQWGTVLSYNKSSKAVFSGAWRVHASPPGTGQRLKGYFQLPNDTLKLNDFFCSNLSRHGFLCSECNNGTSSPIYDYDYVCVSCTDEDVRKNWLFFILLQIIPVTIFFLIIVTFNISATSGPLNAFVFFSQAISNPAATSNFLSQLNFVFSDSPWLAKLILIIFVYPYGIWNLDCFPVLILIPPFCLFQNLKAVHSFTLNFLISALYPLLLIGSLFVCVELHARNFRPLVWMWKRFGLCLGRWRRNLDIRNSIIDAFATFLLLTYTKFCFLSFYLLVPMNTYNGTGHVIGQPRLYFDPSVIYGDTEHIPLICLSVFILVFVIILPPIFLLLYPLKVFKDILRKFRLDSNALRRFVEAFQDCYKDGTNGTSDCRYFASVYFGLRIVTFCSMVFAYDLTVQRLVEVIVVYLIIALFGVVQPYKELRYNRLDVFIFTVLGVVTSFAFYNAVFTNDYLAMNIIMMIAVIVPLIYFIGLVTHRVYSGLKHCWRRSRERATTTRDTDQEEEIDDDDDMMIVELSTDSLPDRMVHPDLYASMSVSYKQLPKYGSTRPRRI